MTPEELRLRLVENDKRLVEALRELGFTPDEIDRQFDPAVPDHVKRAEREASLARKLVTDLQDPKSGLLDAYIDKASSSKSSRASAASSAGDISRSP